MAAFLMGIVVGVVGFGTLLKFLSKKDIKVPLLKEVVVPPPIDPDHMPPDYYGYKHGNYTSIIICPECNLHGLSEDMFLSKPCLRCGSSLVKPLGDAYHKESAKWTGTKWKLYKKDTEGPEILEKSW